MSTGPELAPEDFVHGSAADTSLFPAGRFDWIVSRQVVCHLTDPAGCFATWHEWLKPGGTVVLVDGFWRTAGWGDAALAAQPFAALTEAEPVALALARAGFTILRAEVFSELNNARKRMHPGSVSRYVVAARKE